MPLDQRADLALLPWPIMKKPLFSTCLCAALAGLMPIWAHAEPTAAAPKASSSPSSSASAEEALPSSMFDPHAGHAHAQRPAEPSPEEKARVQAANELTRASLTRLSAYLRALSAGQPAKAALQKAGMTASEVDRLAFLSDSYYRARSTALRFEEELKVVLQKKEEARAAGRSTPSEVLRQERILKRRLADHDTFRRQFFQQVKEENRALIDAFEPEFVALLREGDAALKAREKAAREKARTGFSEASLPAFVTYLNALAQQKPAAEALAAARLDEQTAYGLSLLATDYCNKKILIENAEKEQAAAQKRIEASRAAGKSTSFDERLVQYQQEEASRHRQFLKAFEAENGAQIVSALEKHSADIIAAYRNHPMLRAAEGH